ncbi:MAG: N,N-dimethylformamidase large subunit [Rhodobacter sp.]|jgi:N,N-dimethylformamidase|nr:N,N-dimethylformamidase large subunit [Rhodobacter sp.]
MFNGARGPLRLDVEMPVTGYFSRQSACHGQTLQLKVSANKGGPVGARILRLRSGDANPAGPGMVFDDVKVLPTFQGVRQNIDIGSYAVLPEVATDGSTTFAVNIQPWLIRPTGAVIAQGSGWCLRLDETGITAQVGEVSVDLPAVLARKYWYRLWLSFDADRQVIGLGCKGIQGPQRPANPTADGYVESDALVTGIKGPTNLAAGLEAGTSEGHFNGRMEHPCLLDSSFDQAPPKNAKVLAFWDTSLGIATQIMTDIGPKAAHGRLVNVPTRALRGSAWRGAHMNWAEAPQDYAAVHFHEDDLYDCGWETSTTIKIEPDWPSGVYLVELTSGAAIDRVPFYVLPPKNSAKRICFLASSFTYQAYANFARRNLDADLRGRMAAWDVPQHNPDDYDIYGFSMYNLHPDGSGHHFSSRLRPVMTMRPGFLTFCDKNGSGIRHFPADTHLLWWLENQGYDFDVVTDEDLDDQGVALIKGYDILLTGSHPEYHTTGTMDALLDYQKQGGNFCYLGGNGFYWRVERNETLPGMLELRRAEVGMRNWGTEPGESYHQLKPTYGGLWRRAGRAPQQLCGVGFSSQGSFTGSYYRVNEAARIGPASGLLDGIDGPKMGDYGLNGGFAAGFELDRADEELGTSVNAVILASSENHDASFTTVPEDVLSPGVSKTGVEFEKLIRSDIVWYPTYWGGQVFSAGSIFFCGALPVNNGKNEVSRLLDNVLKRMLN